MKENHLLVWMDTIMVTLKNRKKYAILIMEIIFKFENDMNDCIYLESHLDETHEGMWWMGGWT